MNIWNGNLRKIRVTANKNRAILEPQAIFNEIPASGFSFCSLLFLDIKKPQPLDFSKDCGAYFYYLALITRLLNDCCNPTRSNSPATLTIRREHNHNTFSYISLDFVFIFSYFDRII